MNINSFLILLIWNNKNKEKCLCLICYIMKIKLVWRVTRWMGKVFNLEGYVNLDWLCCWVRYTSKEMSNWMRRRCLENGCTTSSLQNSIWSHLVDLANNFLCCKWCICYEKRRFGAVILVFISETGTFCSWSPNCLPASQSHLWYGLGKLHWLKDHFV